MNSEQEISIDLIRSALMNEMAPAHRADLRREITETAKQLINTDPEMSRRRLIKTTAKLTHRPRIEVITTVDGVLDTVKH